MVLERDNSGRLSGISGDRGNPKSLGYTCAVGEASAGLPEHPGRLERPLKREGDRWVPLSWERALAEIGERLGAARRGDPRGLGLYAGAHLAGDQLGAIRAAAFAAGAGTPNLFSPLALTAAPMLRAAELVLGYPTPLQADVGRAHFTMLLGLDPREHRWGPLQCGTTHTEALAYFRRTRKTRLVVVNPRRIPEAEGADQYAGLTPGTELFFLLGLCHLLLERGFADAQYLRDHCEGAGRLRAWLEPWTPPRVAAICGLDEPALAGIALRFSRAPMATIAVGPSLGQGPHGTLAAWAWLVAHALTANLLRPGGLFEGKGLLDLQPLLASFPTAQAPRSRVSGHPALLLQLPGTLLAEEISSGGEGQLRALIALGDPLGELPRPGHLRRALGALDLLVAVAPTHNATTALADYVLPAVSPWERADVQLLDHSALPVRFIQAVPAAVPPRGESRPIAQILAGLFAAMGPPLLGGPWGWHVQLLGRYLSGADLRAGVDRALELADLPELAALEAAPGGLDRGELDRAVWRVSHPGGRLDLAPEALAEAMRGLSPPAPQPGYPLRLILREARGAWYGLEEYPEPLALLHPERGIPDGAEVIVRSAHGGLRAIARWDASLRPDVVELPWGTDLPAGDLLGEDLDPLSGAPVRHGLPIAVERA